MLRASCTRAVTCLPCRGSALVVADGGSGGRTVRDECATLEAPRRISLSHARGQILEKIDEELRGADDLPSAGAANALAGAVCLERLDSSRVSLQPVLDRLMMS